MYLLEVTSIPFPLMTPLFIVEVKMFYSVKAIAIAIFIAIALAIGVVTKPVILGNRLIVVIDRRL